MQQGAASALKRMEQAAALALVRDQGAAPAQRSAAELKLSGNLKVHMYISQALTGKSIVHAGCQQPGGMTGVPLETPHAASGANLHPQCSNTACSKGGH